MELKLKEGSQDLGDGGAEGSMDAAGEKAEVQGASQTAFCDVVFKWQFACKGLAIQGLDHVLTLGLLKYIVYQYPEIQSLQEEDRLRRLPIYSDAQQMRIIEYVLMYYYVVI